MSLRIITGRFKGRNLTSPKDKSIRPTSERTREAMFNLLMHREPNPIVAHSVLDVCCGSGALGLEALSRGAAHVYFMDNADGALKLTEQNLRHLQAMGEATLLRADALKPPRAKAPVSVVLCDPPYYSGLFGQLFEPLKQQGWITTGTLLVVEQDKKESVSLPEQAELLTDRHYGKARMLVYRCL